MNCLLFQHRMFLNSIVFSISETQVSGLCGAEFSKVGGDYEAMKEDPQKVPVKLMLLRQQHRGLRVQHQERQAHEMRVV